MRFPKLSLSTYAPVLITCLIALAPALVFAQGTVGVPIGGGGTTGVLENPLKVNNFCALVKTVLDAVIIIAMPIAVLFLVLVGFKFILAQGNPGELKKQRMNLLWTLVGIAIFLGSWALVKVIVATLSNLGVQGANACVG